MCKINHLRHNCCLHISTHEQLCRFANNSPPCSPITRNPFKKLRHHFTVTLQECKPEVTFSQEYSICHECSQTWERNAVPEYKAMELCQEYRKKNGYWGRLRPVVIQRKGNSEDMILILDAEDASENAGIGHIPRTLSSEELKRPGGEVAKQLETSHAEKRSSRNREEEQLESRHPLPQHSLFRSQTLESPQAKRQPPQSLHLPSHPRISKPSAFVPLVTGSPVQSLRTRDRKSGPPLNLSPNQQSPEEEEFEDVNLEDNLGLQRKGSINTIWPGGERELCEITSRTVDDKGQFLPSERLVEPGIRWSQWDDVGKRRDDQPYPLYMAPRWEEGSTNPSRNEEHQNQEENDQLDREYSEWI